jgi:ketosteroid isomerase-like protein
MTERRSFLALASASALVPLAAQAQGTQTQVDAVKSVVRRLREALATGDAQAVTGLLAPDAVILEGGEVESRQHYLDHHLGEDIKFAKAVPSSHTEPAVTVTGDTAWSVATSTTKGQWALKPISLQGAELLVLSRVDGQWLIRAIHWSSRKA